MEEKFGKFLCFSKEKAKQASALAKNAVNSTQQKLRGVVAGNRKRIKFGDQYLDLRWV